MNKIIPASIIDNSNSSIISMNLELINNAVIEEPVVLVENRTKGSKKRSKKHVETDENNEDYITPMSMSKESYINSYDKTNDLLENAIVQIDILAGEVKSDIDIIRSSKTLKNKYTYLTDLTSTAGSLINNKIAAIRELNSSITQSHNLDLKRTKELNLFNVTDTANDEQTIMNMYSALVNTPVGADSYPQGMTALGPSAQMMMTPSDYVSVDTYGTQSQEDVMYNEYLNNLTPTQNRMRMEDNPNIQTVVVFNQDTGQRYFDIVDTISKQSIPNVSKPDPFLLEDTTINVNTMTARHTHLDITYPLVLIGTNNNILEY